MKVLLNYVILYIRFMNKLIMKYIQTFVTIKFNHVFFYFMGRYHLVNSLTFNYASFKND